MNDNQGYNLSHGQKRFWIQSKMNPESNELNQPIAIRLYQNIEIQFLKRALEEVAERHFSLRTVFRDVNGEPKQLILKNLELSIPVYDMSDVDKEWKWSKVQSEMEKDCRIPFDLEKGPLFRCSVYRTDDQEVIIYFCIHHIIIDGWSTNIFLRELFTIYNGLLKGTPAKLPGLPIQFIDYAHWQNQQMNSPRMKKQEAYWKSKLAGELPVLDLPLDYKRKSSQSVFALEKMRVKGEICHKLDEINHKFGTTMFMTMVACLNILLSKISNQDDILIGTPISGRNHKQVKNLIGLFVNTIVLRNHIPTKKPFSEFLLEVRKSCIEAYANQDYQFNQLLEVLNIPRKLDRAPIFDVLINFVAEHSKEMDFGDDKFERARPLDYVESNEFDLTLIIETVKDEMIITFSYRADLFKRTTMLRILENFQNILESISNNTLIKLENINHLSREELEVINNINKTHRSYPTGKTIHSLFLEQVKATPDAIAMTYNGKEMSYKKLDDRSGQIGTTLSCYGVKPRELVGVMMNRSFNLLCGIMGVLKAGCAYVPIDLDYPKRRISYMLNDSCCPVLIVEEEIVEIIRNELPKSVNMILVVKEEESDRYIDIYRRTSVDGKDTFTLEDRFDGLNEDYDEATDKDLAYVIYTSGSTGEPKGVMISHGAVLNTLNWLQDTYPLGADDVIAQKTSASFTDSVWEFFWPLITGAKISIFSGDVVKDPERLYSALKDENITITQFVPALMSIFLNEVRRRGEANPLPRLKWVFNGGEALPVTLVKEWYSLFTHGKIANIYGMTESSIYATNYRIDEKPGSDLVRIPLGKPIANNQVYILDRDNKILGLNTPGEICIGGKGLALGYLNNPYLTSRAFIEHEELGTTLYHTGDMGYLRSDGIFEYLGRKDDQVQVRGFRVEIKEVEAGILSQKQIKEVAVIPYRDKEGVTGLICYFTVKIGKCDIDILRENLREVLPDYMIPDYMTELDGLPLTSHGKVDRKKLKMMFIKRSRLPVEIVAPKNPIEEILTGIWKEVLETSDISTNENFFSAGGNSLKIAKVSYLVQDRLHVDMEFRELYENQTIQLLAKLIKNKGSSITEDIKPIAKREYYPVSAAQRRIYVLQQIEGDSLSNHITTSWVIDGELDREVFEEIFKALIFRHEALRTYFSLVDGVLYQFIENDVKWSMEYVEAEEEEADDTTASFLRPFDLEKGPLLRVMLIGIDKYKYILLIDVHHIIYDGISSMILMDEFISLYEGQVLDEIKIHYKDFTYWQNQLFESEKLDAQEQFWLKEFDYKLNGREIPLLNLPTDFQRPKVTKHRGSIFKFPLERDLVRLLKEFGSKYDATLFMVLLSAYNVFLYRYSGQEDIVVGTPVAGRHHSKLERMIGMFVNTLPLRNYPRGDKSFREFVKEVREKTVLSLENQDYQFDQLVSKLDLKRDLSRNPVFDTMFRFGNYMEDEKAVRGLDIKPYSYTNSFVQFDLVFTVDEIPSGGIECIFEYSTELFSEQTIKKMAKHFTSLILSLISEPNQSISNAKMLESIEEFQILVKRNETDMDISENTFVHHMIERQASRTPDALAVTCNGFSMSYRELNEKANRLARKLVEEGMGRNRIIAIIINRSIELIVSMLAVLKAGSAYLPIDPEYPLERIEYILKDSKAHLILSKPHIMEKLGMNTPFMDTNKLEDLNMKGENLDISISREDTAYLIFTSGSTGNPKGVVIKHEAVGNFVCGVVDKIPFVTGQTLYSITTVAFDIFVLESLLPLTKGLRVVLATEEEQESPEKLLYAIKKSGSKIVQMTPSRLQLLMLHPEAEDSMKGLEVIMVGGEGFPEHLLYELQGISSWRIFNMYGPTETTIWSTIQELTHRERVTIGKPIANTQVYVLDGLLNPIPDKAVGSLWIGGKGLAKGYHEKPELTGEKFVKNPFRENEYMYNTGDLARWIYDGELEILGRIDNQIKIRGYRIEIGEIEHQLLAHPTIKEAVVVLQKQDGTTSLNAYFTSQEGISVKTIRKYLSEKLPSYMIPDQFVLLKKVPLTANGKVNYKALLEIEFKRSSLGVEYVAPETELENQIIDIWKYILKKEEIGINDNFFDLGGNSVLLIQMNYRINKGFEVELTVAECFTYSTVAGLAKIIGNKGACNSHWTEEEQKRYNSQKLYWEEEVSGDLSFIPYTNEMTAGKKTEANTSFTIVIPPRIFRKLKDSTLNQAYDVEDFLVAAYTYLLSQLSGKKEIVFEMIDYTKKSTRIYPMKISFDKEKNINELCALVLRKRGIAKDTDLFQIPKLIELLNEAREKAFMSCVILGRHDIANDILRDYDCIINFDISSQQGRIFCDYQGYKLDKSWVKLAIKKYMLLLQKISEKL